MQAKDFKVGWHVEIVAYPEEACIGKLGIVALEPTTSGYVRVWFAGEHVPWLMQPNELKVVAPRQPTAADDLRLTPQARTVLRTMKRHGSISPAEALISLGISRLASCIHEIRARAGYVVDTVIRRDDHGHKYARYSLAKPATVH